MKRYYLSQKLRGNVYISYSLNFKSSTDNEPGPVERGLKGEGKCSLSWVDYVDLNSSIDSSLWATF